ncbi:MAG: hypothetical protein OJF59_001935 [Cytophagales bacterium]|nr:MAG: hypothetical protein OJF59_001935 [Cytophagales bacterium]
MPETIQCMGNPVEERVPEPQLNPSFFPDQRLRPINVYSSSPLQV